MKKILLTALAFGAFNIVANAGCTTAGCANVQVTYLLATDYGKVLVGTSGVETALNCNPPALTFMTLKSDAVGQTSMYAALLTALTTKQSVQINIHEETSDCEIAFINMVNI
jgi:hypothetical protein